MPLIEKEQQWKGTLVIVPEVSLRGDSGLIRVLNEFDT
jgi:hypothetical protein